MTFPPRPRPVMTRRLADHLRFAGRVCKGVMAGCLLLLIVTNIATGQTDKSLLDYPHEQAAISGDGNGVINVKQSDLLQKRVADNWLSYNGDYSGARYSSLSQITPENASRLAAQWVFHPRVVSPREATPVVTAGVMFVPSGNRDLYFTRTLADIRKDRRWVFDHPFFLTLNLAVRGDCQGIRTFTRFFINKCSWIMYVYTSERGGRLTPGTIHFHVSVVRESPVNISSAINPPICSTIGRAGPALLIVRAF